MKMLEQQDSFGNIPKPSKGSPTLIETDDGKEIVTIFFY